MNMPLQHKILIAEDDPASSELLSELLTAQGYWVDTASTGMEALRKLQQKNFDLLLMDIRMPGINGLELIRRIRRNAATSTLPVLAVTAFAMQGDREKGLEAGFDDYITKPINSQDLKERILLALQRRHAHHQTA
jgi:DNA-binding response OmpR family regulator